MELAQALVRIKTITPAGLEEKCFEPLSDPFSSAGFNCRHVEFAPGRKTLVARIGGRTDKALLCFTGHVDVVPLGSKPWSHDPFGGHIVDGRLYSRGSSDMKAGDAAFTVAAIVSYSTDAAALTPLLRHAAHHHPGAWRTRSVDSAAQFNQWGRLRTTPVRHQLEDDHRCPRTP
ncbi:M20/M25/M40 family metallo-hydrolase [Hydrogenophaga sp.]|uniref:M20/M25/M40 family metallo-hydrolase n=1 Tax=Hydrogenophaga sp. TaxID=1904254 RepID=UPI0027FD90E9|nr:M20/M25/M40 family metallo-hydrolase [Hydrogenophaga sp.]